MKKQGPLLKRSPHATVLGGKKMQERHFVLDDEMLRYYVNPSAMQIKGKIPVGDMVSVCTGAEAVAAPAEYGWALPQCKGMGAKSGQPVIFIQAVVSEDGKGVARGCALRG